MIKKILALFLCSVIILNATNLNDMITTYKSSAGSWQSPSTGMKYHYGGAYEFTFKGNNRVQPWVTMQKPEASVSCNGISLKGGFVGLLGLNEIKDQIRDAGASLAWGAMIALQYAVPALFQVFNEIRKWAATIQRMLQNACNIGTMMAMNNDSIRRNVNKVNDHIARSTIGKFLTTGLAGLESTREEIDKFVNCSGLSTTPPSGGGLSPAAKCTKELQDQTFVKQSNGKPKVATTGMLTKSLVAPATSPDSLKVTTLSKLLKTGKINTTTLASGDTLTNLSNTIKIMRIFFGDISLSKESYINGIVKNTTAYDSTNKAKPFTEGTYTIDKDQIKKSLENSTQGKDQGPVPTVYSYIAPVISNAELAAKALMNGITASANNTKCIQDACYIDDAIVYYYDFSDKNLDRTISIGIIDKPSGVRANETKLTWKGAYSESLTSVRTLVRNVSGITPIFKTMTDGTGSINSTTLSSAPLLVPNINNYINIISKIEKDAKGETPTSLHLKDLLAKQNAFFIATSLLDLLYGKVLDASSAGGSIKDIEAFNNTLEQRKVAIEKELASIQVNRNEFKKFNDIFLQIEESLQRQKVRKF